MGLQVFQITHLCIQHLAAAAAGQWAVIAICTWIFSGGTPSQSGVHVMLPLVTWQAAHQMHSHCDALLTCSCCVFILTARHP